MTEPSMQSNNKSTRFVTPILVAVVVVAVTLIALRPPPRSEVEPRIYLESGAVVIEKPGTRLIDIARAIDDDQVFSYDEAEHKAISTVHLSIAKKGGLAIGSAKQPETLEFNTNVCGDASLSIGPDARLDVINSEIATTHRTISAGVCTRGYTVFCYGTLVARDSSFLYISGNRSEFFGRTGSGVLDKVIISRSDGASLRLVAVDGSRLSIRNSSFITGGKYGLYLLRRTKTPVRIEDTTLLGAAADVFMSSGTAELVLVDCTFRKNKVSFVNSDGSVRIKWRAHVKVEKEGRPVAGAAVVAESEDEKVTATTDEDGLAVLEVTEQILTARGARMITPHVFRVIDGAAILAESEPVAITRKAEIAGEVRLTIE